MKHIKLFEKYTEAVSESLTSIVDDIRKELKTRTPNEQEVANYVYDNYDKVTGKPLDDRDDEDHFPQVILDIVDKLDLDLDLFTDFYGQPNE